MHAKEDKISLHCIFASLYFLLLPLTITTNSTSSSFLKLFTIPIGMYFLISLLFYRKEFQINVIHLILVLYTISTVITLFVDFSMVSIKYTFGYFLNAALFLCLSVIEYNDKEMHFLESVQIVLLVIVTLLPHLGDTPDNIRTSLIIFGQKCDPNYFVGYFIFPLSIAMKRIFESRFRLFYIITSLFSIYTILLTGSRGGLLAIIVTMLTFAVIYPKTMKKKAFVITTLAIIAVVFWFVVRPFLPEIIIERMSIEAVVETRGTYRGDIWKSMLTEIKNSDWEVIFGRGLESTHVIMMNGKEETVVAHNQLIQLMYNQGVIGLVLFLMLVITCIFRCIKKRKCVSVALIGMMALAMSLTIGTSTKSFWNLIPYAAIAFTQKENHIKHKEEILK